MKLLLFSCLISLLALGACKLNEDSDEDLSMHWAPSPREGAFKMEDYMVWGGSVIKAEDGNYYMFASRWPEKLTMKAWVTNSEIVLAVSDHPAGPYTFKQVVLPERGKEYWDGMMTHNPHIHYHDGMYILYYIGTTYDFVKPKDSVPNRDMYEAANNNQRIGIAVADSPYGPWERMNEPVLEPRQGMWDAAITVNPAAVIHENGSAILIYKSAPVKYPERRENRTMRFGIASAENYLGPYSRADENNEILFTPVNTNVEDPFIWFDGTDYRMIAKCMDETITGERNAGFMASSSNGKEWKIPEIAEAYSRTIHFSDGSSETMQLLERPQVLFENGKPSYVFFACRNKNGETFNIVRPIETK